MNQQQQVNQQTQQVLQMINGLNLPPAQSNVLKNLAAQAHISNSVAFHFLEHNQNQLLSPLSKVGTTINLNFSNLNQMVNLGPPQQTNLGDLYIVNMGPFTSLLRLGQAIALQRISKEALPPLFRARNLNNAVSQISDVRGIVTCMNGDCGGSNVQCTYLSFTLEEQAVFGAVISCRLHAPSFQGNQALQLPMNTEVYIF